MSVGARAQARSPRCGARSPPACGPLGPRVQVHPEARRQAVQAGALQALLSLAQLPRNVAARDLARQALLRCTDDEGARARLEEVAGAAGIQPDALQALLTPNSARSAASSQRRGLHRKMHSGGRRERGWAACAGMAELRCGCAAAPAKPTAP